MPTRASMNEERAHGEVPCTHDWHPGEVYLRKTGAAVTYHCNSCDAVSYDYGDIKRRSAPSRTATSTGGPSIQSTT